MEQFTVDLNLPTHKSFRLSVKKPLLVLFSDPYSTSVFFCRKRSNRKETQTKLNNPKLNGY
ncbi:hypothetical protein DQM68_07505 [Leptospira mayottensis]|uniref:Uncharacterized protein n=1 Tax=Leptospira mayottensis TaxID=1137606 RepID=A0ABN5NWB8_9LEPT|nr:hypothetical protein DQM68_07505 [Leptospira mayottensis]AXR66106.1 hypothetical protein DQM28_09190 [Leptospira mayottensis]AZQ03858.1 hypothetical protein LEP1GSC190_14180 [Leptospira mayottensis 200901116]TGN17051.1 hypothetical protein EHR03_02885 [Leptospira mayottensis]